MFLQICTYVRENSREEETWQQSRVEHYQQANIPIF